jgi:iron complex transport system substrate-binding protein
VFFQTSKDVFMINISLNPRSTVFRRLRISAAAVAVLSASLFAASSASAAVTATKTVDKFPAAVRIAGKDVRVPKKPKRIVSISPTATEMLFAIGAGSQVVAVDDQSSFPVDAPRTKLSGFQPNVEAIASYKPDLVFMSQDDKVAEALRALKIPVAVQISAIGFNDSYRQIREAGILTGHRNEANTVVVEMKSRLDKAVTSAPKTKAKIFHELDDTLYTVTSATFIGQVYAAFGVVNIADAAPGGEFGYPQLNAEFLAKSNPDVIFLADTKCCGQTLETVSKRPGWADIAAVKKKAVVALDDDIASRWGPRLPELFEAISAGLKQHAGV